ncbi:MAG: hypothetical protein Q4D98_08525 [Planctomycetia bacterium]|nr:hypothetical protein [Planctomycetia bacterium]
MSNTRLYIFTAVVGVLIILGALFEGGRTSRWSDPQDPALDSFAAGIQHIPPVLGPWKGDTENERREMDNPLIKQEAGAESTLTRMYFSDAFKKGVTINIICGLSRKVAIHTPDACYRGQGYVIEGEIEVKKFHYLDRVLLKKLTAEGMKKEDAEYQAQKEATFKTALFVHESQDGYVDRQRVYWGWKGEGTDWIAPDIPRNRWRPTDPICKLYLSVTEDLGEKDLGNPVENFGQYLFHDLDVLLSGTYQPPAAQVPEKEQGERREPGKATTPSEPAPATENLPEPSTATPAAPPATAPEATKPEEDDLPELPTL